MRRALPPLAASLVILLASAPTGAQGRPSSAAEVGAASSHFERGTTLYSEGDYGAALIEFKRAYEVSPSWQVLFNIGQSYFQLRDYANALLALEQFAREGGDRIAKEDRSTLDTELPELAKRVATVTIISNLDGATVSVDGHVVGKTPLREPVLVSAGIRQIAAAYDDLPPVEQRLALAGRDVMAVQLSFPTPVRSATMDRSQPAADRARRSSQSYIPTYASFLIAGGGLVVGSVSGVLAMQAKERLDRVCTPSRACPMNSQSDINSLARDSSIATVGFGVGAVGFVTGVVLWLAHRPWSGEDTSTAPRWSAGIDRGQGFFAGSF
jgi:hypothetical protein